MNYFNERITCVLKTLLKVYNIITTWRINDNKIMSQIMAYKCVQFNALAIV